MKKINLFIIIVLSFMLVACGNQKEVKNQSGKNSDSTESMQSNMDRVDTTEVIEAKSKEDVHSKPKDKVDD